MAWTKRPKPTATWSAKEGVFYLLNEDGTYLLNEDGSKIILQESTYGAIKWTPKIIPT